MGGFGVALFAHVASALVVLIARGVLGDAYGHRRRRRTIERLHDHTIICGYGRAGRRVTALINLLSAPAEAPVAR